MANITITINDAQISRAMDAFNVLAGEELTIRWDGDEKIFSYNAKTSGETNMDFGKRLIATIIKQFVKVYEKKIDNDRYSQEINSITPSNENIPEDIIS